MKKISIFAAAALAASFSLTSCSNDKYHFDPNFQTEVVKSKYNEAFTALFGTPDATQNWGFQKITPHTIKLDATRATNPNGNQWADFINVPEHVSADEAQYVYDFFKNLNATEGNVTLNFSDFFVQQVWKGTDAYTAGNGGSVVGGNQMDYLFAGEDHVYNFNNAINNTWDGMMLIQNGSTDKFSYHNSLDSKVHDKYIAMAINVPGHGVGYYVAFDYIADGQNPNQKCAADGVYTDWIVKIVPGVYKNTVRIMCEDLGTTDDFDFNDVVFDVAYTEEWWPEHNIYAVITLQAAGGTMPLYVEGKEVHEAMGAPVSAMINTGAGVTRPVVQWKQKVASTNPDDIEIKVVNETSEGAITYTLTAPTGKVPYKICVPSSVAWTAEKQSIEAKYPNFKQWVANKSLPFWN